MFEAFARLPGTARGAIWMLGASLFFGTHGVWVRFAVGEGADPLIISFWRSLVLLLLILPWIVAHRRTALRTAHPFGQLLRVAFSMIGLILLVTAQANLPLAEVSALTFAAPLFGMMGAALFLGEVVRVRRWVATLVGFAGVWIVLRPGVADVSPLFALPLISALFIAGSNLMIRYLSKEDAPTTTVAWLAIGSVPFTLVPALFAWAWPTPMAMFWMAMLGAAGLGAHICLVRAFTAAEASAVLSYDYSRLIITSTLGFFIFAEIPTFWTWVGGAVIVGAVVYIARQERKAGNG